MRSAIVVLLLAAMTMQVMAGCPTVSTVPNFNLTEYIRASWYINAQQINGYQSKDDLYCVTATYNIDSPARTVPFFSGEVVSVYNYANKGAVNGSPEGSANGTVLCARIPDSKNPSSLLVAPCFLPNFLAGPYLVIAVDPEYNWAVVSGGQPTVQYSDGCTTAESGINDTGLWIFTREPVANPGYINAAKTALVKLGYTLQRLLTVPQGESGCQYSGAFLKH